MSALISVIIPTRNRCDRLAEAIASVKAQTWPSIEVIVVDDASSDETPDYLARLQTVDPIVRVVRHETPVGGGAARNAGLELARGAYAAFLDDDDLWLPSKLERQAPIIMGDARIAAVSCSFLIETPGLRPTTRLVAPPHTMQSLLRQNHLGGASVCLARVATLRAIGGFDPKLRSGQDWDLWLKLGAAGEIAVCAEPLVRYRVHAGARISGHPVAAYHGRRRIYCRYRDAMSPATRRYALCELAFLRKVVFRPSLRRKLNGVAWVAAAARGLDRLRFPVRFARLVQAGGLG